MRRHGRSGRLRAQLADEAARLMVEEGISQYLDAKQRAARRLLGRTGARRAQFRPNDLPSNGEIREAVLRRVELSEGPARHARLFAMRAVALEVMAALDVFSPRLIGSVSTGHIRRGSDIDLHTFTDEEDTLLAVLGALSWPHEVAKVAIRAGGAVREYTHVYLDRGFPVELSVYPRRELRQVSRSSTDGRPIDRVSRLRLEARMAAEHPVLWRRYRETEPGVIPDLEAHIRDAAAPSGGEFDGLLAALALSAEEG